VRTLIRTAKVLPEGVPKEGHTIQSEVKLPYCERGTKPQKWAKAIKTLKKSPSYGRK